MFKKKQILHYFYISKLKSSKLSYKTKWSEAFYCWYKLCYTNVMIYSTIHLDIDQIINLSMYIITFIWRKNQQKENLKSLFLLWCKEQSCKDFNISWLYVYDKDNWTSKKSQKTYFMTKLKNISWSKSVLKLYEVFVLLDTPHFP